MTFALYLSDLGRLLKEMAVEAKHNRDSALADDQAFAVGRLIAFRDVMSLMQEQLVAFNIPLRRLRLEDINPENDLL